VEEKDNMSSTRELRRRIRSIKNTSQITKAMQMVAATKMRKAQNQALSGRPYTATLNSAIATLLPRLEKLTHPLLKGNNSKKSGVLLLTTDKGLCGALNTNIFRALTQFISTPPSLRGGDSRRGNLVSDQQDRHANARDDAKTDLIFYTLGKKGRTFLVKTGRDLAADFENTDLISFRQATQIAKLVLEAYLKGEIGSFYIIYPDFVSALRQEAKVVKLLPVDPESLRQFYNIDLEDSSLRGESASERRGNPVSKQDRHAGARDDKADFLFEPNLSELLDFILNHYFKMKIYQSLLETKASEHSARMIAMQSATDNAKELVSDLTLSYNQTRQESITKELLEITSALAALE